MRKIKIKTKNNKPQVKNKQGNILCIILKEGKGSKWKWLSEDEDRFSIDGHTYFKIDEGTHIYKNVRVMIYLEGISLPIHHGYIDREEVTREYMDKDTGKTKKVKITKIKGLNFDSKVIDMPLNRNLADEFTKNHMDLPNLAIVLLLVVSVIVGIANIGMWFL